LGSEKRPEFSAGFGLHMCGIAGFTQLRDLRNVEQLCQTLDAVLKHRGPDDRGWLIHNTRQTLCQSDLDCRNEPPDLVLLHRRLSIIDLSKAGWQPMTSADGRHHVIFNGEIYNYLELRRELAGLGSQFRSNSDTEVLLHAFIRWGAECLSRFVGMFAFVVFDSVEHKLFLARDFFGIKPLYYVEWAGGLAFASEIKALLIFPGVSRRINSSRLYAYLADGRCDGGDETLFESVRQLPAGHLMEINLRADRWPQPKPYWRPQFEERLDLSFNEAASKLRDLFVTSVSLHLRSDVPIGACLSGGIDSSAIVHAMRHLGGSRLNIHTFTYAEADAVIGEEMWADRVNEGTAAVPHKIRLSAKDLRADLQSLISVQDEPFVSTSIYAQYSVFRAAREAGIIVMLDGQGADEILAGYPPFIGARIASLVRTGQLAKAWRLLANSARLPGLNKPYFVPHTAAAFFPKGLLGRALRAVRRGTYSDCINSAWFGDVRPAAHDMDDNCGTQLLKRALQRSLSASSLPSLLRYEDRNSMAFSIESRVPFLTPAIVEFVYRLPEEFIIGAEGTTKHIFRAAMRGLVPDQILDRRDKIGFATAEDRWLRALTPWIELVLSSDAAKSIPAINSRRMLQAFRASKGTNPRLQARVWRWVNAIEWSRHWEVSYNQ
jgi:asparagine synthase (glutamine-hydrolysing)